MADQETEKLKADVFKPRDEAEERDIRKLWREVIKRQDERKLTEWHESAAMFASQIHELRKASMLSSVEYGKIYVRFAFLLNGGAMIALLAFIGALFGRSDIANVAISFSAKMPWAFGIYSGGLLAAALSAASGYLNFQYVYATHFDEGHLLRFLQAGNAFADLDQKAELAKFAKMDRNTKLSAFAGSAFGALSLVAFVWATFLVANAFFVLGV